jgi:peptide/nickel transport system permease protein
MNYLRYLGNRLAFSGVVIFSLLIVVWFMVNQVGDPARLLIPVEASKELYETTRLNLGLDDPVLVRLWRDMSGWLLGDFGNSLWQNVPAMPLVLSRLPDTLILTLFTLSFVVPLALLLGIFSALRPDSLLDRFLTTVSLAGVSIADFWLGLMLILVLAVQFGLFPTSGSGNWTYMVLPAIALAMRPIGRLAQVTRSSLVEEMRKPYITTLRAQGMKEGRIVRRHALKNSLISVITIGGDELATFLNGAVVIETLFAWPGIGSLFIQAIQRRDLPLILACVFVVAVMVVLVNLLVDLAYAWVDPRASVVQRRTKLSQRLLGFRPPPKAAVQFPSTQEVRVIQDDTDSTK